MLETRLYVCNSKDYHTKLLTNIKSKMCASKKHINVKINIVVQHVTQCFYNFGLVPFSHVAVTPMGKPARVILGIHQRTVRHELAELLIFMCHTFI